MKSLADIVDEERLNKADLRGSQADSYRFHEIFHRFGQMNKLTRDLPYGLRLLSKDGTANQHDFHVTSIPGWRHSGSVYCARERCQHAVQGPPAGSLHGTRERGLLPELRLSAGPRAAHGNPLLPRQGRSPGPCLLRPRRGSPRETRFVRQIGVRKVASTARGAAPSRSQGRLPWSQYRRERLAGLWSGGRAGSEKYLARLLLPGQLLF